MLRTAAAIVSACRKHGVTTVVVEDVPKNRYAGGRSKAQGDLDKLRVIVDSQLLLSDLPFPIGINCKTASRIVLGDGGALKKPERVTLLAQRHGIVERNHNVVDAHVIAMSVMDL